MGEENIKNEIKAYKVEFGIRMVGEKHCIKCPLRDPWTDRCNILSDKCHGWEEQLKNCPLTEVNMNDLQPK